MNNWSKEYELSYWKTQSFKDSLEKIKKKYNYIGVDIFLADREYDLVVDIGGGLAGGVLSLIKAKQKILVDRLVSEFKRKVDFDELGIELLDNDVANLSFKDNSVDVVFCFEVFDHLDSVLMFKKAQRELVRIVKNNGLIFFEMPIRSKPIEGHPISLQLLSREEIVRGFKKVEILKRIDKGPQFDSPNSFILVMKKNNN